MSIFDGSATQNVNCFVQSSGVFVSYASMSGVFAVLNGELIRHCMLRAALLPGICLRSIALYEWF